MRFIRVVLLGSTAALSGIAFVPGARAADLPARQAAPIEYVRICDAYGAGFFYIPGTQTCLRIGGMTLAELRGFDGSFSIVGPLFCGNGTAHSVAGFVPLPSDIPTLARAMRLVSPPWAASNSIPEHSRF